MKKPLYLVGIAAVVGLLAYIFWPHPPTTLIEAVRDHAELFPAQYRVVLPLSATSRLGYSEAALTQRLPAADYMVASDAPCFFVRATTADSLTELRVKYGDRRSVTANLEAKNVASAAGLSLTDDEAAEMVLSNLRLERAVGWPNLNGPCTFTNEKTVHTVVTSQLVAKSVTLSTSRTSTAQGSTSTNASQAPATASTTVGWSATSARNATGNDIVLTAILTPVTVTTTSITQTLGATPEVGRVWPFPPGLDGGISIDAFDAGEKRVSYRVSVPGNATEQPPPGVQVCPTGQRIDKGFGERCDFLLPPGSALLSVTWDVEQRDGVPQLRLGLKGYKTTFSTPKTD